MSLFLFKEGERMGNLINLEYDNRFLVPNETVRQIFKENSQAQSKLEKAAVYHKENLLTIHNKKQDSVENYLRDLADSSFKIEYDLYSKLDKNFADSIEKAYRASKKSNYLTQQYQNNLTYGQALTNLFYGGESSSTNTALTILLTDLAHLDVHQLIKMTEVSNEKMVGNIIVSNIDTFMHDLKIEKNIAAEIGGDTLETFANLLNENNIMTIIQQEEIKESEVKKIIKKELLQLQKSPEFLAMDRKSRQSQMLSLIELNGGEMKDAISFLIDELIDKIWAEIGPYTKKGVGKKTIRKAVIELLSQGKLKKNSKINIENEEERGFTFSKAGAVLQKNGQTSFTLAAYSLNANAISQLFSDFLIKNETKKEAVLDIKQMYNMTGFDEAMIMALQGYNEALQKYLLSKGHQMAWEYYVQNFLSKVVDLAKRDYQEEKTSNEAISNMSAEIRKGVNALQIAHSVDEILTKIEILNSSLDKNIDNNEINSIIEMATNYLNKDKKDIEILNEIKNLIKSGSIKKGIKDLKDRLTSKRAGFISNFNGSIGEIFITAIEAVVFNGKNLAIYQKGSSQNLRGQSAHADITIDKVGIQSKIYKENDIKLYKDTTVSFKTDDALRYLRTRISNSKTAEPNDELSSFRFFLLNNTILQEIGSTEAVNDNFFLQALNLRLENFIRYSDGLTKLGEIKNNFYLINFNIVPASVIFLKMAEIFEEKDYSILIKFFNEVDGNLLKNYINDSENGYLLNNNNVLSLLKKTRAEFSSFTLKLSELGVNIF